MRKVKSVSLMISVLMVLSMVSIMAVAPVSAAEAGTVELDKDWYKTGDGVTVTVKDADLNILYHENKVSETIPDGDLVTFSVVNTIEDVIGASDLLDTYVVVSVDLELKTVTLETPPPATAEFMTLTAIGLDLSLTDQPLHPTKLTVTVDTAPRGTDYVRVLIKGYDNTGALTTEEVNIIGDATSEETETVFASVVAGGIDATKTGGLATEIKITATNGVYIDYKYRVAETVEVAVTSTTDEDGFSITLDETGDNTGEFKGTFTLIAELSVPEEQKLQVSDGDTVTATYEDEDPAGTRKDTAKVDDTKPTIEDMTPADTAFTNDNKPTISAVLADEASGIDNTKITLTVGGTSIPAENYTYEPSTGLLSFTPGPGMAVEDLVEGSCTVILGVWDIAGNDNSATWTFTVDVTPPTIPEELTAKAFPFRIDLEWKDATDPESGEVFSGLAYYNIYRSDVETTEPKDLVALDNFVDNVAETTYMDTALENGVTYYYAVTAVDEAGNEGAPSNVASATFFWKYPTMHYTVKLSGGWNLMSLPLIPESDAIENVISGVEESVVSVWTYDAVEKKWHGYGAEAPGWATDLETMEDGKGYWMYMSKPATLEGEGYKMLPGIEVPPAYNVMSGWNLIGFKSMDAMKASDYLGPVTWTSLRMWDTTLVRFVEIGAEIPDGMTPGYGYWIYVDVSGQIVPPLAPPTA